MAIAGSGGWVPSCRVEVINGQLVAKGMVNNKPAAVVYSDTEKHARGSLRDAFDRLALREAVTVDMTGGQFLRLVAMWKEQTEAKPLPSWAAEGHE